MKQEVLLTGAAGFIGSHIAEGYIAQGYRVIGVDDLSTGNAGNIAGVNEHADFIFYRADLRELETLKGIFAAHNISIINHHAAQKSVPASIDDPQYDNAVNVSAVLNLIACARAYNVKRILAASSGGALSKPIEQTGDTSKETDMPQLVSPYAITKFSGERYFALYANLYGYDYIGLRYANVFGPRQVATGDCGVVPIFLNNILANKPSRLMTYADMPRGCSRDYIYVRDVMAINMLLSQHEGALNDVFNLALGKEFYMLDIYEALLHVFERNVPIELVGPRQGDIRRSVLDVSKVKRMFGWSPAYTFDAGLRDLKQYYVEQV
jgi:UDP-glucose 4-epimerase